MPSQAPSPAPYVRASPNRLCPRQNTGSKTDFLRPSAYGIFQIHHGSLLNWQYLFVIEGSLTCVLAIMAWFVLPSGPGSAWFLTEEERVYAAERIRHDSALFVQHEYGEDGVETDRLSGRDVVETAKDWKLWFVLVFNICASVPTQAFSVFLPLVLAALGYSKLDANLVRNSGWKTEQQLNTNLLDR